MARIVIRPHKLRPTAKPPAAKPEQSGLSGKIVVAKSPKDIAEAARIARIPRTPPDWTG